jgi:hypothetical protein
MITDKLKEEIATYIKDSLFDTAKIGLGGNSTNPVSNDLDVALSVTPTLVKTKSTANVIEAKISISGSVIQGKVIREAGLFNGSDMVHRLNFDGVGPFSSTETLEIFVLMEVE